MNTELINTNFDLEKARAYTLEQHSFNVSYFEMFINYYDAQPKTIDSYKNGLKSFSVWLDKNNISKPTREDLKNYRDNYLKANGYKATTIHAYINALKRFFEFTSEINLYPNIAVNLKSAKITNSVHRKDALTLDQSKELLNSIDRTTLEGKRNFALISLVLTSGLRVSEVMNIDISDLQNKNGYRVVYIKGKGHEEKDSYNKLAPEIDNALREYITVREPKDESEPLFISTSNHNNGERLTAHSISRIIKTALRNIGLNSERLTAHSLRHTTATLNIKLGGSLEDTREILRHENANTTLIYINETNRDRNNSELNISKALFN